jgi:hypothetical protein
VIFQEALKETHVMEVKRIFRYLKETKYFGLCYLKGNKICLVSYTDVEVALTTEEVHVEKLYT